MPADRSVVCSMARTASKRFHRWHTAPAIQVFLRLKQQLGGSQNRGTTPVPPAKPSSSCWVTSIFGNPICSLPLERTSEGNAGMPRRHDSLAERFLDSNIGAGLHFGKLVQYLDKRQSAMNVIWSLLQVLCNSKQDAKTQPAKTPEMSSFQSTAE